MEIAALPGNIVFSNDLKSDIDRLLSSKNYSKMVVLLDNNTRKHCYPILQPLLTSHLVIEIDAGEERKNLDSCVLVWQQLTDSRIDRKGLMIVLGGGVPGDLGGFCAATYKRGIDFVLMPTTLLSQVDASVGGKLGVDFGDYKNHIGVFQEPVSTIINSVFLKTLPLPELRSGFAEVIKHCLLSDKVMWDEIRSKKIGQQDWPELVEHSVRFKARVVTEDPREAGMRKVLNFGHTLGHAIESQFLRSEKRLLHGEAIAIGMIAESFIAHKKGMIACDELGQITKYLIEIFGKENIPSDTTPVITLALQDKKNVSDKILIAVPNGIGHLHWDLEVTQEELKAALAFYSSL